MFSAAASGPNRAHHGGRTIASKNIKGGHNSPRRIRPRQKWRPRIRSVCDIASLRRTCNRSGCRRQERLGNSALGRLCNPARKTLSAGTDGGQSLNNPANSRDVGRNGVLPGPRKRRYEYPYFLLNIARRSDRLPKGNVNNLPATREAGARIKPPQHS